jgi:hypothetical protein
MLPRDLVYIGHMLDMTRKAVSKTQGIFTGVASMTTFVWQVVAEDLPQLVAALQSIAFQAPPPPRATGY